MTETLTPEQQDVVNEKLAALDKDFLEVAEYARKRSNTDRQLALVVAHLINNFYSSDLCYYIAGAMLGTASALKQERASAFQDGVVEGAIRAAKILGADSEVEDQGVAEPLEMVKCCGGECGC